MGNNITYEMNTDDFDDDDDYDEDDVNEVTLPLDTLLGRMFSEIVETLPSPPTAVKMPVIRKKPDLRTFRVSENKYPLI